MFSFSRSHKHRLSLPTPTRSHGGSSITSPAGHLQQPSEPAVSPYELAGTQVEQPPLVPQQVDGQQIFAGAADEHVAGLTVSLLPSPACVAETPAPARLLATSTTRRLTLRSTDAGRLGLAGAVPVRLSSATFARGGRQVVDRLPAPRSNRARAGTSSSAPLLLPVPRSQRLTPSPSHRNFRVAHAMIEGALLTWHGQCLRCP